MNVSTPRERLRLLFPLEGGLSDLQLWFIYLADLLYNMTSRDLQNIDCIWHLS